MNIGMQISVHVPVLNILGIYLELELLDHMVNLCLNFWRATYCFAQWLHHFIFPPSMHKDPNFSISSPTLVIFWVSLIAILMGVKWYFTVVLICITLMISGVEYFLCVYWPFVYLLWRNVYSSPLLILNFVELYEFFICSFNKG